MAYACRMACWTVAGFLQSPMQEEQRVRDEQEKAELAARKAEIAERRRLQEEANQANKGKKGKKKAAPKKQPTNKNGRIGIRTYALGRDYEPDRFGGVTPYRDPQEIIDEQAIEEAYSKKRSRKQKAVAEALTQAEEAGDLEAVKKLEEQQAELEAQAAEAEEAVETAETEAAEEVAAEETAGIPAEAPDADALFEQINDELSDDTPSDEN